MNCVITKQFNTSKLDLVQCLSFAY